MESLANAVAWGVLGILIVLLAIVAGALAILWSHSRANRARRGSTPAAQTNNPQPVTSPAPKASSSKGLLSGANASGKKVLSVVGSLILAAVCLVVLLVVVKIVVGFWHSAMVAEYGSHAFGRVSQTPQSPETIQASPAKTVQPPIPPAATIVSEDWQTVLAFAEDKAKGYREQKWSETIKIPPGYTLMTLKTQEGGQFMMRCHKIGTLSTEWPTDPKDDICHSTEGGDAAQFLRTEGDDGPVIYRFAPAKTA
ncbi:hypothetical protein H0X32_03485 [Patescibacteria group bacterium]|nr:hypothetical protein [Patescibacteria group bacterium]